MSALGATNGEAGQTAKSDGPLRSADWKSVQQLVAFRKVRGLR